MRSDFGKIHNSPFVMIRNQPLKREPTQLNAIRSLQLQMAIWRAFVWRTVCIECLLGIVRIVFLIDWQAIFTVVCLKPDRCLIWLDVF